MPTLNALKAFEVAGSIGNFTRAAETLKSHSLTADDWLTILLMPWITVVFAVLGYFLGGRNTSRGAFVRHSSRGSFVRLNRKTRKIYHVAPGKTHLNVLDWDRIEAMRGYVPVFTASSYTQYNPLYLIGVDYTLSPPTEICLSLDCDGIDESRTRALWEYLQLFMEFGAEGLPEPAPRPPRLSRRDTTLRGFREWNASMRRSLSTPSGRLYSPVMLPLRVAWLVCFVFPDALGEFIQYNVPYTGFPKEIDELCGFVE